MSSDNDNGSRKAGVSAVFALEDGVSLKLNTVERWNKSNLRTGTPYQSLALLSASDIKGLSGIAEYYKTTSETSTHDYSEVVKQYENSVYRKG